MEILMRFSKLTTRKDLDQAHPFLQLLRDM